ncbi:u3 small nucleolar ribonucleoprotein protein MPP10 [Caerostris darwini]|uniref:U3 small nucleolar ribonucleoprotein protein MPP10 n=1 Tax=Caerostris darwini TaxID=1538125 RepID=A0AAV4PQC4_9ARAC|nr:u3 small nucleolar ribonucleoprotein protein MPP10 [Caerostris darwini]
METSMCDGMFLNIINNFSDLTENPEILIQKNSIVDDNLKSISKSLHDYISKENSVLGLKSKSLSKLLTKGFDDEQIWQQIDLRNEGVLNHLNNSISELENGQIRLDSHTTKLFGDDINNDLNNIDHSNISASDKSVLENEPGDVSNSEDSSDEEYDKNANWKLEIDGDSDEDEVKNRLQDTIDSEEFSGGENVENDKNSADLESEDINVNINKSKFKNINSESDESDISDIESSNAQKEIRHKQNKFKSIVDDQFFKLSKLEQFLRVEDIKEERARDGDLNESDDEEEEIDYFQDIPDDPNEMSARNCTYDDFFASPGSEEENDADHDEINGLDGEDSFDNEFDEEDEEEDEDEIAEAISKNAKELSKTPYELQQENINKQISEYEENLLCPKPWQLTGEVDVNNRPIDGLLDLPTDFQMNAKPMVIQDKEFCERIENLIKMTIKNKAYSDPVRQEKPVQETIAFKKEIVLDHNKSKKGLAEEYEEMYLKKKTKEEEEGNPKHKEIIKCMDSLLPELYALFTHIPKPAVPDIKVVSNLPAITVEEVAPTSYSDATLLAPEEIKKRTGLLKGKTERTDTDRKRERRKKKLHQKTMYKKKEKENSEDKPLSGKGKKKEKLAVLKKLKQHKNTKIATMDAEKVKSSKDFFDRLQETVSNAGKNEDKHIKKKRKL